MSGIYLHIPFCKQACHYCNFHFSTSLKLKDEMVDALCTEIKMRGNYLSTDQLKSIYFGGGTPSILEEKDLSKIINQLAAQYSWSDDAEITLEANPDDLNFEKIRLLKSMGINRLSIGIQSFHDADLNWMNRAHNAQQAENCIKVAQDAGFDNITIDLIYGSPATTDEIWNSNIEKALSFQIPHISSYCLTVEEKTALHYKIKTGKMQSPIPEQGNQQYEILMLKLSEAGFDHYEISNFGKPGYYAIHNTSYWQGVPYLGIGPSAHSYDGVSRSWNIAHNKKYIDSIMVGDLPAQAEILDDTTRYNEYIMTGLRTMWGVDLKQLNALGPQYGEYFLNQSKRIHSKGWLQQHGEVFTLTHEGKFFADRAAMELFWGDQ
ncbi:MAG: radical SAM family heme chaperone HemW [Saprospiraceae bacterium]|nr:radical SAM family heme chaperone HemW [Saprospiraceae bacterium]MCZ2338177.1 radical SAM family heme chaperone HemW [Chitinophagales bacterium]